jgi:signal transduction histidine kinase
MFAWRAASVATRRPQVSNLHAARHVLLLPVVRAQSRRCIQTATVTDADIQRLAAKPLHPLTLADLCKHGRPPPSRLAHRIQSLRALPYIVVANPNVSKIHSNYVHSLSTLLPYAERKIETLQDEIDFTEVMADLVHTHSNTIEVLARGFLEARKYISPEDITRFLDEHLRARIGTRLIAEQHIALHFSSKPHKNLSEDHDHFHRTSQDSTYIGVIDTDLKPAAIIRNCEAMVGEICELKYGVRPSVVINGDPETTIAHIPMHLEYVLAELLKNSFRATIEAGMEKEPIEITIAPAPAIEGPSVSRANKEDVSDTGRTAITNQDQGAVDQASGSHIAGVSGNIKALERSTPGVTIRIRDRGGGISPQVYGKLWEYGFTTFNEDEMNDKLSGGDGSGAGMNTLDVISGGAGGGSTLAGLGYGLKLGRAEHVGLGYGCVSQPARCRQNQLRAADGSRTIQLKWEMQPARRLQVKLFFTRPRGVVRHDMRAEPATSHTGDITPHQTMYWQAMNI